jgi:uncharacterized membrane protein YagU involved in acid resistance
MAGGLIASWAMNVVQAEMSSLAEAARGQDDHPAKKKEGDDATVKAASAISESLAGHKLTAKEKKIAGPAVHYAFGSAMGAVYGAASELAPASSKGFGLAFGSALWFGADEIGVPAAGLSKPPSEIPASTHASALAMHLFYGMTVEGVRRLIRSAI